MWICHVNWDRCFTGCPLEWLNYRDKCYFFSKDLHNFDSAKAACEALSASLLIISDKEEQVNLVQLATDVCRDKHECVDACLYSGAEMAEETSPRERLLLDGSDWRGGGKRVALDRWDWACVYVCLKLDRCLLVLSLRNKHQQHHFIPLPFTCSMWKPGQPDNWGHGHDISGEDCAGLVHEALWNDFFCQDLISYICEKELQQREEFIFIVLRASWKPAPHFVPLVSRSKTTGFIAKSGGRSNGGATRRPLCGPSPLTRCRWSKFGERNRTMFDLSPGRAAADVPPSLKGSLPPPTVVQYSRAIKGLLVWTELYLKIFFFCIPRATKYLNVYFITQVCKKLYILWIQDIYCRARFYTEIILKRCRMIWWEILLLLL